MGSALAEGLTVMLRRNCSSPVEYVLYLLKGARFNPQHFPVEGSRVAGDVMTIAWDPGELLPV